ncbi:uncharacterized protein LOC143083243 isoform X1 [Mytilus galloprovincialis]|uniref:uncharacterized protein LOC143083243 isoform X1 n=1 Tax=Mytilus galloprovincialis TaxID=29158 RepID=UPI003F7B9C43
MAYVMSWHGLAFCVVTNIFGLVNTLNDEPLRVYITSRNYTWFEARKLCTLFKVESTHVQINELTVTSRLMWTHGTATFLPWVEYLGCFELQKERIKEAKSVIVKEGTQLSNCLLYCQGFKFIGLQQHKCICLNDIEWNSHFIRSPCNIYPVKCRGDPDTFCGKQGVPKDSGFFSVYKTATVNEANGFGNCLAISIRPSSSYFLALKCSTRLYRLCLTKSVYSNDFYQQSSSRLSWISSFQTCPDSYMLARYSMLSSNTRLTVDGTYWLSNTRRWIQEQLTNPEYCIAARVQHNGYLESFPIRCNEKFPGLCITPSYSPHDGSTGREMLTSQAPTGEPKTEQNGNNMISKDQYGVTTGQSSTKNLIRIGLIAVSSLTFLVVLAIIIVCIRMKKLPSNSQNHSAPGKDVVYAKVEKSINRKGSTNQTAVPSTSEDTYDHIDHRLNRENPDGSTYDTMQNVRIDEENEYEFSNESEIGENLFICDSMGYSQVSEVVDTS